MIVTVSSADNGINWGAKDGDRVVENVRNILRTRKFEVPFMREMGINSDYVDSLPNQNIVSDVMEAIRTYESRANVLDVRIDSADENGDYIIIVELEV